MKYEDGTRSRSALELGVVAKEKQAPQSLGLTLEVNGLSTVYQTLRGVLGVDS